MRTRAVVLILGLWVLPAGVLAQQSPGDAPDEQEAETRGLVEAGRASFDSGRYAAALDYFQRAHDLSGRAALLYDVGRSADRLHKNAIAIAAFEKYLKALPDAPNGAEVEKRLKVLKAGRGEPSPPATTASEPEPRPETTAATPDSSAVDAGILNPPAPADREPSDSILGKWWFWTAVAVVAAGSAVAVVLASGEQTKRGKLTAGSDGVVITTLELP